jgi:threonine dehydrogenase-like Zn-dependent dehydrogenase
LTTVPVSSCGRCQYCRDGRQGQRTRGGGWILGYMIDGTQAEYVRVQIDAARFVTHHFTLNEIIEAYDTFGRAADTGAVKVVMTR